MAPEGVWHDGDVVFVDVVIGVDVEFVDVDETLVNMHSGGFSVAVGIRVAGTSCICQSFPKPEAMQSIIVYVVEGSAIDDMSQVAQSGNNEFELPVALTSVGRLLVAVLIR